MAAHRDVTSVQHPKLSCSGLCECGWLRCKQEHPQLRFRLNVRFVRPLFLFTPQKTKPVFCHQPSIAYPPSPLPSLLLSLSLAFFLSPSPLCLSIAPSFSHPSPSLPPTFTLSSESVQPSCLLLPSPFLPLPLLTLSSLLSSHLSPHTPTLPCTLAPPSHLAPSPPSFLTLTLP